MAKQSNLNQSIESIESSGKGKHKGQCICGKTNFFTTADPQFVFQCNCARCRRMFGTVQTSLFFKENDVVVRGKYSKFGLTGGSGKELNLFFCPNCGTHIHVKAAVFDGMTIMVLGAFDEPEAFPPDVEIFTNYKLPWLHNEGLKESFEEAAIEARLKLALER